MNMPGTIASEDDLLQFRRFVSNADPVTLINVLHAYLGKVANIGEAEEALAGTALSDGLSRIPLTDFLSDKCVPLLQEGLKHPKVELRKAVSSQLVTRAESNVEAVKGWISSGAADQVLDSLAENLTSAGAADKAISALRSLLLLDPKSMGREKVREAFSRLVKSPSGEVRFRFYELLSRGSQASQVFLATVVELGWLGLLVAELQTKDILVQLNALEVLGDMAAGAVHCAVHLHSSGVTPHLAHMLEATRSSPEGGFLFPAIIRFFGHLAVQDPVATCTTYPTFLQSLWQLCLNWQELEPAQRLLAFDTLALLGGRPAARAFLHEHHRKHLQPSLAGLGAAASRGPEEIRVRHYTALADLFRAKTTSETETAMLAEWWSWVSPPDSSARIAEAFRLPLPGLHESIGAVVAAVAGHPWGASQLLDVPGFLEYLLDRSTENEMKGRYAKFDIVSAIIAAAADIPAPTLLKLKEFQREGPYNVVVAPEAAVDWDNAD